MLKSLRRPRTTTNPVFYGDQLLLALDDEERYRVALSDPDSVDFLAWNVFASLDTHTDRDWLAHRLEAFGGSKVRAPVRMSLWTGRRREPLLRPSTAYLKAVRERTAQAGAGEEGLAAFLEPIEVPVRIETPDVLILVDTALRDYPRGSGGRDRLLELIDAGLDAARRVNKALAVAAVYPSGDQPAAELSARIHQLREREALAAALPHRDDLTEVTLREVSWQQFVRVWDTEQKWLRLGGQPVRAFLEHVGRLGLR